MTSTPPSFRPGAERGGDPVEYALVEADEIHLVDRHDHLANAEHSRNGGVAARLRQQALARIHQQHRDIRRRCAGDHVAGVLFVARRVGEDEAAALSLEIAVRDVDRDALLPLGREAIHQQGVVDRAAPGRAVAAAVAFERLHHVVRDAAALVEQAADERGFAVIHAAAGEDAKERLGHQKYPSRFFFSIEAS